MNTQPVSPYQSTLENYHQARWCEPLLFEISEAGHRASFRLLWKQALRKA
jgi:hypothetical protein